MDHSPTSDDSSVLQEFANVAFSLLESHDQSLSERELEVQHETRRTSTVHSMGKL